MPSSRESCRPRDQTPISYDSCIGRLVLYHQQHPYLSLNLEFWSEYQTFFPASNSEKKNQQQEDIEVSALLPIKAVQRKLAIRFVNMFHYLPALPTSPPFDSSLSIAGGDGCRLFFVGLGHLQQSGQSECLSCVLICQGCYNKVPQTRWFRMTEIYCSGGQKSEIKVSRPMLPLRCVGGGSSLACSYLSSPKCSWACGSKPPSPPSWSYSILPVLTRPSLSVRPSLCLHFPCL